MGTRAPKPLLLQQKGFRCPLNSPSEKGLLGDNLTRFVALDGRLGENSDQKLHKKRNV